MTTDNNNYNGQKIVKICKTVKSDRPEMKHENIRVQKISSIRMMRTEIACLEEEIFKQIKGKEEFEREAEEDQSD